VNHFMLFSSSVNIKLFELYKIIFHLQYARKSDWEIENLSLITFSNLCAQIISELYQLSINNGAQITMTLYTKAWVLGSRLLSFWKISLVC